MRRTKAALAVITAASFTAALAVGVPTASAAPPGYDVFVGYADSLRPNAATFPTPFDTGPGITNLGRASSNNNLDSGAVRLVNTTAVDEHVDSLIVHVGSSTFDLWPHGVTLSAFSQLVFVETVANNFDSSDAPFETCTPDGIIPQVEVSIDGTSSSYLDTGQVLNTGGIDSASCGGGNESQQWVSIGAAPCPQGADLHLTPGFQVQPVFGTADVTGHLTSCGSPLQGATVAFTVMSGPNAGLSGAAVTDANGEAHFSYSSAVPGSDTVTAAIHTNVGDINSDNSVNVLWTPPTRLSTTPSPSVPVGGTVSDVATLSGGFNPSGPLTFYLYRSADCQSNLVYSHSVFAQGAGNYSSGPVLVTVPGQYEWVVVYDGNALNNPAVSPCGAEPVTVTPQLLTGRAYGLSLGGLVKVKPTPDTGPVATTGSHTVAPACVLHIGTLFSPVKANALCASVVTSAPYPSKSTAAASIASATVAVPRLPIIQVGAVQSASATSCAGSVGSASIVYLKVGNTVVIGTRQVPRPNYTVNLGVLKIVMNEQTPFNIAGERGLTVNAIHITGLNGAINLVVASAESDIGNCP